LPGKASYIVSACLCGIPCRYDGTSSPNKQVVELVRKGRAIPICPEVLGGLSIPRIGMDLVGGEGKDVLDGSARVISRKGEDLTVSLVRGALASFRIAKKLRIKKALMKQKSPSCGCGLIKRRGRTIKGDGVTTALFKREGITVTPR
jgi:uncharacterized protein YbbK (DUF523 family)